MEDFMNQFRKNLEDRPEPPFEQRNWQALEKRLDREDGKRPAMFAWWWVALPFALLLLTSNTLFFLESRKANEKITALENRYAGFSAQHDTVFVKEMVYRTDTVYQTRIVREYLPGYAVAGLPKTSGNSLVTGGSYRPSQWVKTGSAPVEKASVSTGAVESKSLSSGTNSIDNQSVTSNFEKLDLLDMRFLEQGKPKLHLSQVEPSLSVKKKTLLQLIYPYRPKGFRAGITGGGALAFSKGFSAKPGFSTGVEAAVSFTPNLSLWADAAFYNLKLSSNKMDAAIGIPLIFPPNDQLVFEGAEVLQHSLQYSAGMQYTFNASGKLKPYMGLGLGAITQLNSLITYDFKALNNGPGWIYEAENTGNVQFGEMLFLRAGVAHDFSRNLGWTLHATYRNRFGKKSLGTPNILGIQAGLMVRFGSQ